MYISKYYIMHEPANSFGAPLYSQNFLISSTCAAQLLQSVYDDLTPDPRVLDITVEDASDEFCALRDFVDCRNALKMACFQPPAVHEGFGAEMERECKERLKLHKVRGGGELWIKGRSER